MWIEIDERSRCWRRRLGWLQWSVLEDLALSARPEPEGWIAAVGVRGIARNLGMTKDTAAKALTALGAVGIVERVNGHIAHGRSRSGYRVNLPRGVAFQVSLQTEPGESKAPDPGTGNGHDEKKKRFSLGSENHDSSPSGVLSRSKNPSLGPQSSRKRRKHGPPGGAQGRLFALEGGQ